MTNRYINGLSRVEKERYEDKIQEFSKKKYEACLDPYQKADNEWKDDISMWPPVEFGDIYGYLIDRPGEYTKEKLKAYKSLEAYNYYSSGWVQTVFYAGVSTNPSICLLKAKVRPSQRLNDELHNPWVAVYKASGEIITGHCTCMAGCGEVCSHVAALLFKVEACVRLGIGKESCTSLPCIWNQAYSKTVEPSEICDISFMRPNRKRPLASNQDSTAKKSQASNFAPPRIDRAQFLKTLHSVYPSSVIFSVSPGFSSRNRTATPSDQSSKQSSSPSNGSIPSVAPPSDQSATCLSFPTSHSQLSSPSDLPSLEQVAPTSSSQSLPSKQLPPIAPLTHSNNRLPLPTSSQLTPSSSLDQLIASNTAIVTSQTLPCPPLNQLAPPTNQSAPPIVDELGPSNCPTSEPSSLSASALICNIPAFAGCSMGSNFSLPSPLSTLQQPTLENSSDKEIEEASLEAFANLKVTATEAMNVFNLTKEQSKSADWFTHRFGRITSSNMHAAFKTTGRTYPFSLAKTILQHSTNLQTPALKWGKDKEETARIAYTNHKKLTHQNVNVSTSGLVLNPRFPFLGSSPDGICNCDCCGYSLVEIKCPFKYRAVSPVSEEALSDSTYCLKRIDGNISLNSKHSYYTQVQGHLLVAGMDRCDFVCWTTQDVFIEVITKDSLFLAKLLSKLRSVYIKYILPELLSPGQHCILQSKPDGQDFCHCRTKRKGRTITCCNPGCDIKEFHYACVGIKRKPKGIWYCKDCTNKS